VARIAGGAARAHAARPVRSIVPGRFSRGEGGVDDGLQRGIARIRVRRAARDPSRGPVDREIFGMPRRRLTRCGKGAWKSARFKPAGMTINPDSRAAA
jgi:hypothetical protein